MKKILILIVFITLPILSFSQNSFDNTEKKNEIITMDAVTIQQLRENQMALRVISKTDVTNLNYRKSFDLISIKAYRKSLQIRVKEVRTC